MKKFLAVVKREYIQRVRAKMFIVSTVLLPIVMSLFVLVPALIFSIETPPIRVAIVDQTGRMYAQLRQGLFRDESDQAGQNDNARRRRIGPRRNVSNFELQEVRVSDQSLEQV